VIRFRTDPIRREDPTEFGFILHKFIYMLMKRENYARTGQTSETDVPVNTMFIIIVSWNKKNSNREFSRRILIEKFEKDVDKRRNGFKKG